MRDPHDTVTADLFDDYGPDDEPLPAHYEDAPEPYIDSIGPEQPWDRRAADYAAANWAAWRTNN